MRRTSTGHDGWRLIHKRRKSMLCKLPRKKSKLKRREIGTGTGNVANYLGLVSLRLIEKNLLPPLY